MSEEVVAFKYTQNGLDLVLSHLETKIVLAMKTEEFCFKSGNIIAIASKREKLSFRRRFYFQKSFHFAENWNIALWNAISL